MDKPEACTRDENYYFDDGSVVLCVENVLFKIQASRLANVSDVFRDMLHLPQVPDCIEGTCDANPIPLPEIKAEQFRNLLYIFYESPVNPDLIVFMSGASNEQNHSPEAFRRYLDIASLSHRYLMQTTENWAYAQLQAIVATISFAERAPLAHLHDALNYAKIRCSSSTDDEFLRNIRNASACAMCGAFRSGYCLDVYRGSPTAVDRFLYGLSYICVLSLGYESKEWGSLTRDDRAILYASQVRLAPFPDSFSFRPLAGGSDIASSVDEDKQCLSLCQSASALLSSGWPGSAKDWYLSPIDGILRIRALPLKRKRLAKAFNDTYPCQCDKECGKKVLARVDALTQTLLNEILDFRETLSKDL